MSGTAYALFGFIRVLMSQGKPKVNLKEFPLKLFLCIPIHPEKQQLVF